MTHSPKPILTKPQKSWNKHERSRQRAWDQASFTPSIYLLFILMMFQLVSLGMQTGVTGLTLIVKGHIHDDFADTIVEFNGSSAFFLEVFNMQPVDICSRFQQWVCNQKLSQYPHHLCVLILTCILGPDMPDNLQAAQNKCATLIKKGLHKSPIMALSLATWLTMVYLQVWSPTFLTLGWITSTTQLPSNRSITLSSLAGPKTFPLQIHTTSLSLLLPGSFNMHFLWLHVSG